MMPGDEFPKKTAGLKNFDDEDVELEIKEGQLTMLVFWQLQCKNSKRFLDEIHFRVDKEMEKWGDKVRIVLLSTDYKFKDQVKGIVAKLPYKHFEFFFTYKSLLEKKTSLPGTPASMWLNPKG